MGHAELRAACGYRSEPNDALIALLSCQGSDAVEAHPVTANSPGGGPFPASRVCRRVLTGRRGSRCRPWPSAIRVSRTTR